MGENVWSYFLQVTHVSDYLIIHMTTKESGFLKNFED